MPEWSLCVFGDFRESCVSYKEVAKNLLASFLITVRGRRVDQALAGLNRLDDALLALGQVGHLEDAEPQNIGISRTLFNTASCITAPLFHRLLRLRVVAKEHVLV